MILGIAGTNASGKDTVSSYLIKKGFIHYSHSDILREDLRKQGIEVIRENLQKYGNEIRAKYGSDILTRRLKEKLQKGKNYVITSIRNEAEVKSWQKLKDFKLVWVDAPIELRFKRSISRPKTGESVNEQTFEDFKKLEEKEWDSDDPNKQQLKKCKELASETIINDSALENFHKKIDKLI